MTLQETLADPALRAETRAADAPPPFRYVESGDVRLATRFFVITCDVRGAGRSSAPRGTAAYALEHLVDDFTAVAGAVSP